MSSYLSLQKLILKSSLATSTPNEFTWQFDLNTPVRNVVCIDWLAASEINSSSLIQIKEIPSTGSSISGSPYNFYIIQNNSYNSNYNTAVKAEPSLKFSPLNLSVLTVSIFTASNQKLETGDWELELCCYVQA